MAFRETPAPLLRYPSRSEALASAGALRVVLVVAAGVIAVVVWAAGAKVDRVTRGTGRVVAEANNKTVQHLEGGIVTDILVREGERVAAGDVLLRVENSFARAELQQNGIELKAKRLQSARLSAETEQAPAFVPDAALARELPDIAAQEEALFRARAETLSSQRQVLDAQKRQKEFELAELKTRFANARAEREFVVPRVESLRRLARQGAVSNNELLEAERSLRQIEGKSAEMVQEIPRIEQAIVELEQRRVDLDNRFRSEAERERRDMAVQIAKIEQAIAAMQDRSRRSDILAPIDGTVQKLFVTTLGGVARPGEPLALIVPSDPAIIIEAKVAPKDRAQIWPGLPAAVKVSAYDYTVHGVQPAQVLDISPDVISEERGEPYFRVRLRASATALVPERPIIPGMLVQVDIIAGQQTVLDYLIRPMRQLRAEALRQ